MAFYVYAFIGQYEAAGGLILSLSVGGTLTDQAAGNTFETTDTDMRDGLFLANAGDPYVGSWSDGTNTFYVCLDTSSGDHYLYGPAAPIGGFPATYATLTSHPNFSTAPETVACFGAGTRIATPGGDCKVEALSIGDLVLTSEGRAVPVLWIGRHSIATLFASRRLDPVRIREGALGDGLPHSDLTVTADHGMIVDGLVINAGALVNGGSIDWVPLAELPERVTYYHIETEAHEVILANGAPAETFIDYAGRRAFDNYAEYLELYGAERIIREMPRHRISDRRLVPEAVCERLGIPAEPAVDWDDLKLWDAELRA